MLGARNPKVSSGQNWRYGKKGSLSLQVGGESIGKWHNFETGDGGNLLGLIQRELGLDFKGALKYGAGLVGLDTDTTIQHDRGPIDRAKTQKAAPLLEKKKSKIVERIAREAIPLKGTLGESYLKTKRGIRNTQAKDIRFHPNVFSHIEEDKAVSYPALVSFAFDRKGKPTGMQAVYLDAKTGGKVLGLEVVKRSFGRIGGSQVVISEGTKKGNGEKGGKEVSFVAEGIETAMSVREAQDKAHVIAVLGKSNFKNIDPQGLGQRVCLCLDIA